MSDHFGELYINVCAIIKNIALLFGTSKHQTLRNGIDGSEQEAVVVENTKDY